MHGGLHGMPRRTMINDATYLDQFGSWDLANIMTGIGGTIMFLSAVLFFVNVIVTLTKDPDRVQRFIPIAEVRSKLENGSWMWLDDIVRWTAVAFVFSAIIYGEVFFHLLPLNAVSRGLRLW
jgi:cytochrome c oxidase subunit 1